MAEASAALQFEQAARLRDEIEMLESLRERGELENARAARGVFHRSQEGPGRTAKDLEAATSSRGISKASTSPTWAATKRSPASCSFSMACRSSRATGGSAFATSKGSTTMRAFAKSWLGDSASCGQRRRRIPRHSADRRRHRPVAHGRGGVREAGASTAARAVAGQEGRAGVRDGPQQAAAAQPPSYALRLLQYVRDEAHRFAQHYHHILRRKRTLGE